MDGNGARQSGEEIPQTEIRDSRVVAYHEAGHCVAAFRLRIPFNGRKALTILPTDEFNGLFVHKNILRGLDLEWDSSDRSRLKMEKVVQACLAGIEAQRRFDPTSIRCGEEFGDWDGGDDYRQAVDLIDHFTGGPKETDAYLELLRIRTESMIGADFVWRCVEALAQALLNRKSLSGKEAMAILQSTLLEMIPSLPAQV